MSTAPIPTAARFNAFARRVGHDATWLAFAGLFCVVEGAVKLTELSPRRLIRSRRVLAIEDTPRRESPSLVPAKP